MGRIFGGQVNLLIKSLRYATRWFDDTVSKKTDLFEVRVVYAWWQGNFQRRCLPYYGIKVRTIRRGGKDGVRSAESVYKVFLYT